MARNNTWVNEPVTPYRLASILSAAMTEALGVEVTIAPQQLYGAVRSGSLPTERFDSGHIKVTPEAANEFIAGRIERYLQKETAAEAEETVEANA